MTLSPGARRGAPAAPWSAAVEDLWDRVTGGAHPLRATALDGSRRRFEVHARAGVVHVSGTDATAACVGIHRYLREAAGRAVTWGATLPIRVESVPDSGPIRGEARVDELYDLNFCTFAYSTAYWGWAEWEREIDWMALHGVTLPLQLVGHEATLARVYAEHGLTDERVRDFLGDPGHLPFVYMGTLDSDGSPLPAGWIAEHEQLGRRILERERSLGMRPILPAFTGHVPAEIAPPGSRTRDWQGLRTTVVAPEEPLFRSLAGSVVRVQTELYGTDHLYAADPFIEMIPADTDPDGDYPAAVAAAIVDGLTDADPAAVWVLQSWPFSYQSGYWTRDRVDTFVGSVPDGRLLVLDLWAEADPQWPRLGGFAGRPWIWSGLLNFGGRSDAVAGLPATSANLEQALASTAPPVGLGLSMEAIHTTPAFFELVTDRAWAAPGPSGLDGWLRDLARHRYGTTSTDASRAWSALGRSLFAADPATIFPERFASLAVATPSLDLVTTGATVRADVAAALTYDPADVLLAIDGLLRARGEVRDESVLADDVVSAAAAVLVRLIDHRIVRVLATAAEHGTVSRSDVDRVLTLFDELDALVATRPSMRLATWVDAAARWAADDDERAALERDARRLLTVWNTPESPHLDNYAIRLWGGLVGGYLRPRWEAWFDLLPEALDPARRPAAQDRLTARLTRLGEAFVVAGVAPVERHGDPFALAAGVLGRLGDEFRDLRPPRTD